MNPPRTRSTIRALLVLNAALLLVLAAVTFSPTADAQGQGRARGDYVMVGGNAPGTTSAAVYIVDAINQEMIVVSYNQNTKALDGVAYRNLAADAQTMARGQSQPSR
jgi:DUF917 family protein